MLSAMKKSRSSRVIHERTTSPVRALVEGVERLDRGHVPLFGAGDLQQLLQVVAGGFAVAVAADQERRAAVRARSGCRLEPIAAGDGGDLVAQLRFGAHVVIEGLRGDPGGVELGPAVAQKEFFGVRPRDLGEIEIDDDQVFFEGLAAGDHPPVGIGDERLAGEGQLLLDPDPVAERHEAAVLEGRGLHLGLVERRPAIRPGSRPAECR